MEYVTREELLMSVSKSAREKMQGSMVFGAIKMLFYLEKLIILVPNIKNINIKNNMLNLINSKDTLFK